MQIDTGVLFPLLSLLLAAGTFFIGRITAASAKGTADGEMKADIKHIKTTQQELKEDIRLYGENYTEIRAEMERIKGRLAKLEEIVEIYHRRDSGESNGRG